MRRSVMNWCIAVVHDNRAVFLHSLQARTNRQQVAMRLVGWASSGIPTQATVLRATVDTHLPFAVVLAEVPGKMTPVWIAHQPMTHSQDTELIGQPCPECHAPTERIQVLSRRVRETAPNPHAAALGRLGGLKGGPARVAALSPERRREIARRAALRRWAVRSR
jgi:hypothetical protein